VSSHGGNALVAATKYFGLDLAAGQRSGTTQHFTVITSRSRPGGRK
jgi:hypothetical protein